MDRNPVIIKSNPYGLILLLDPEIPFEDLTEAVAEKFRQGTNFFQNAQMALTFRGRELTGAQERRLADAITANSKIRIVCLVDEDEEEAAYYKEAVTRSLEEKAENEGQFYRGTLRSGEVLETDKSVVILGDVNPGAQVISRGSIVVLGCCMGKLYAGASGNDRCFAAALILKPSHVRIADKAARSAITKRVDTGEYEIDPKIIRIKNGALLMEPLSGKVFAEDPSEPSQREEHSEG